MLNFFRRFLSRAAETQAPLNNLLQGNWTPATVATFEACKESLAEALLQQRTNGHWKPLDFFSKKLSPTESNYGAYDRKLLAVYLAVKRFRHMVEAQSFTIYIDHKPIMYAFQKKNTESSTRKIRHLGFINPLSLIEALETSIDVQALVAAQQQAEELERFRTGSTGLQLQLVRILGCNVLSASVRRFHTTSLSLLVRSRHHQPGLSTYTLDIVIMPLSEGCRYCLTTVDRHTRCPEAVPISDQEAAAVAQAFYGTWIARFGTPLRVTTDQGRQFESYLFKQLNCLLGTTHLRTTAYHHSANRMIERLHRQLKASATRIIARRNPYPPYMANLSACPLNSWVSHATKAGQTTVPQASSKGYVNTCRTFVFKDFATSEEVFIRHDGPKQPLQQPYDCLYRAVRRSAKTFVVNIKGRDVTVSIDRFKSAYVLNGDTLTSRYGHNTTRTTPTTDEPAPFADQPRADDEVPKLPQQRGPLGQEDSYASLSACKAIPPITDEEINRAVNKLKLFGRAQRQDEISSEMLGFIGTIEKERRNYITIISNRRFQALSKLWRHNPNQYERKSEEE
ncbi:uncharacterized protein LOC135129920 [Zophobas morio]|uniref:uncharacterized protein LOC135129920 n=1 Tax=Zophobas morio TaxID=2755281 RepID=UPI0030838458